MIAYKYTFAALHGAGVSREPPFQHFKHNRYLLKSQVAQSFTRASVQPLYVPGGKGLCRFPCHASKWDIVVERLDLGREGVDDLLDWLGNLRIALGWLPGVEVDVEVREFLAGLLACVFPQNDADFLAVQFD